MQGKGERPSRRGRKGKVQAKRKRKSNINGGGQKMTRKARTPRGGREAHGTKGEKKCEEEHSP